MEWLTPTCDELLALVGDHEVYLLDAHAQVLPLPGWMLEGGATESTQSVSERLELVHPEDRSVAAEMFLTALCRRGSRSTARTGCGVRIGGTATRHGC